MVMVAVVVAADSAVAVVAADVDIVVVVMAGDSGASPGRLLGAERTAKILP